MSMSQQATAAPASAKAIEIARPMPPAAPRRLSSERHSAFLSVVTVPQAQRISIDALASGERPAI
jgi:hypothetical protein